MTRDRYTFTPLAIRKRGQFEAIGLAVIVILISLGMFFMLYFSLQKKTDFPARYDRQQASQNFVDSFLRVNAERCSATMEDLLLDAAVLHLDPCGDDSQEILRDTSFHLLNRTFDSLDGSVPYDFTIRVSGETDPLVAHQTCISRLSSPTGEDADNAGLQDIPLLPTTKVATIALVLCS